MANEVIEKMTDIPCAIIGCPGKLLRHNEYTDGGIREWHMCAGCLCVYEAVPRFSKINGFAVWFQGFLKQHRELRLRQPKET